jgi:signal transduction histidine kinase/DNA-binding response OmpR family regulator
MHRLLRRQLRKHLGIEGEMPAALQPFLAAVDAAYVDFDTDRAMLERSLELSSKELSDARDAATQARSRLTDALESISEGFFLFDADDRMLLCNSRFCELYPGMADVYQPGLGFEQMIRTVAERQIVAYAATRPQEWVEERLARHRNPGQPFVQPQRDGRWIQVSERKTQDGGTVGVFTDVTELKRREEELAAARDQAMAATQAKSKFLAGMSHELRTPLNAIIGFTRLVMRRAKDTLPPKQYENLEKILVSAEHLLSLINTVLDLSKIEAGRTEVKTAEFPLGPLLDLCLNTVEPMVKADRVQLIKDVQGQLPALYTDQGKLKQILINLLSNAAKFTEGGSITLRAQCLGEQVELVVADTGCGIPKAALELIFEEFRQIDSGAAKMHTGTGLGLTISRRLARMLGGDIAVESEVGKGSTFTITIPVRLPGAPELKPKEAARGPAAAEAPLRQGEKLVLAIDDDRNVLQLLKENLADAGYCVVGAESGQEGLQKARELRPRAITLDIIMPDIDGWQVLHTLKTDPLTRDIPVILISIIDQTDLGFRLGAVDYLVKPFDGEALVAAMARVAPHCRRILVVDDDPNVAELVRQLFEGEQLTIDWAQDGAAGLDHIAQVRPGVILLDLVMPRMDGFAFLEVLQRDAAHKDIPVIVLTAMSLPASDRRMLRERVLGLMEKHGLDREALIREVRRALLAGEATGAPGAG